MHDTELDDNARTVRITRIVCLTIAAFLISGMGTCALCNKFDADTTQVYIKNGYTKESQPGQSIPQWVKKQ